MGNHLDSIQKDFKTSPFWDFICLQLKELKKGYVELYLPYNPNFRNVRDSVHGGIYASVLDTSMGMAGRTLGSDEVMTIQMNIQFLKPIVEGGIYSEASVISESRSTALIEGRLFDEDKNLIAHSVGTFRVVKSV